MTLGFIGLGIMGRPMALNLARAGVPLVVWNRTSASSSVLAKAGARVADAPHDVFRAADAGVILMLAHETAMDAVLGRSAGRWGVEIADRTLINMGTFSPAYAKRLADEAAAAGGRYVEAPVSGSRGPAEAGTLVAMLAGEPADVQAVEPLLAPMCAGMFRCGSRAGDALRMKLAVNHYLVAMVASLAEAAAFAGAAGLDLEVFARIIAAGPLSSPVALAKLDKLRAADWTPQATLRDVFKNADLIQREARSARAFTPLLEVAAELFEQAARSPFADQDMIALARLYAERAGSRAAGSGPGGG
ncbi:MAG: NAD(P)-dependent oxidoreductase [Brevundimonas sp.]